MATIFRIANKPPGRRALVKLILSSNLGDMLRKLCGYAPCES